MSPPRMVAPLSVADAIASADGRSALRRFTPLVWRHRRLLGMAIGMSVVSQGLQLMVPRVLMRAIDTALVARTEPLAPYGAAIAVLGLLTWFAVTTQRVNGHRFAVDLEADLRTLVQQHIGSLSARFLDQAPTGQLVSRANEDIKAITLLLVFGPLMMMSVVTFAGALGIMLSLHVGLTFAALATLPLVWITGQRMQRSMFPVAWLIQSRTGDLATIVEENLAGAHVVRGMSAEAEQVKSLTRSALRLRWVNEREIGLRARYQPLIDNLPRLGMAMVFFYGGYLAIDERLTLGALVAFNAYLAMIALPLVFVGHLVMLAQRSSAAASRILEVLDERPAILDAPDATELEVTRGAVVFERVTFAYEPDAPVLEEIDLVLEPGETVALVGSTASGKTTLARLLLRLYDPTSGRVLIDGQDIRTVTTASLRSTVSSVLEDPFLFTASVGDNIAYAVPGANDATVQHAAHIADAEDFISALPSGYDTVVGERGYSLSGGQRQRLAIARAIAADPLILILDDATSAIDVHVEQSIHDRLTKARDGRTTLIVAHRWSTIALADRVVVLDAGRIAADGTHAELLASSALYRQLLAHEDEV
ncbi:MAG: ATP-binding cassette subfamily B protein [Glaciecola sp.]|jgi:ATP-binding cassette subfamily B protein